MNPQEQEFFETLRKERQSDLVALNRHGLLQVFMSLIIDIYDAETFGPETRLTSLLLWIKML